MFDNYNSFLYLLCLCLGLSTSGLYAQATLSGEMRQYHKVTLTFESSTTYSETNSTYEDVRMDVTITSPSSKTFVVPGYFAADGNAAESSATSGNKWKVNFNPSETGTYSYVASFRTGNDVAVNGGGSPAEFNGESGSFSINATNKSGDGFRAKGKFGVVDAYAARFPNGDYYFEVGADSPETFLEYSDFDATSANNTYSEVANNYASGDPSWKGGRGTEIIGAVNYLANQGMNVHYFLTNNITGDGNKAYPFPNAASFKIYDVSKLGQWEIVFDHMYNKGIALEVVLLETENLNWFEDQEGVSRQNLSNSRKIYYRELMARFGYLNVIWNIGEEANWSRGGDQYSAAQIEQAAEYIEELSPYDDLIAVHNGPSSDFSIFPQLAALAGTTSLTSISMQGNHNDEDHGNGEIANLRDLGDADGRKLVVRYSEPFSGSGDPNLETWTNDALWASICAGSVGIHYYAGGGGDITGDDYTDYAPYFQRMGHAKDFLEDNDVPFWNMEANNNAVSNGFLLSEQDGYHVIFLKNGGTATVDLIGNGDYDVKWFDPRNGGNLLNGSTLSVPSGNNISIGSPPNSASSSWVVLLRKNGNDSGNGNGGAGNGGDCDADYQEVDNIVVIEAEDLDTNGQWSVEDDASGFSGSGFLEWGRSNHFNDPGNGTISVSIQINDPGKYRFQWRNSIGEGNSTTDENDSWLRFPDADDFYGERGSSIVYPNGSGKSPNPNGAGSNGWLKVYSNTINWNWTSNTSDRDPHQIYVEFDSPGVYTMEISARSRHHLIDRIVLSKSFNNPTDLSLNVTQCDGSQGSSNIPVQGVDVSPNNTNIILGETVQLDFNVNPNNATNKSVTWSSNNNAIVSVDGNGNITGIAEGTATIEVTTVDGNFTDTATISVEIPFVNVTSINVSPNSTNVILGETVQLTAQVVPNNATNQAFSWSSTNTALATVDTNGEVTALGLGTVTITALTDEGGFIDSAIININEENNDINVEDVTVSPKTDSINVGEIQQLTFQILPMDATDQSVGWASSNNGIATVNAVGRVSGIAPGVAVIRVITLDGNFVDTAIITVKAQNTDIPATGVTVNTGSSTIQVGNNINLTTAVSPSNATDKRVTWSSSDEQIASVNSNGFVNALSEGAVLITATTVDGGFVANAEISVIPRTDTSEGVIGFVLVDGNTSLDLMELTNGTVIDGNVIDIKNLNIRINTLPETIGSVSVTLSGPISLNRTENLIPYAVFGDSGFGAYTSENLPPGNYVLSATAFSERGSNGDQIGDMRTIEFEAVESSTVSVESITVSPSSSILEVGQTLQLSAATIPENATIQQVSYISSNEEIATVDSGGLVTAVSEGSVEIIGQSSDGGFTASANITVTPLPIILPLVSISTENFADEGNTISIIISLDRASEEAINFDLNYINVTANQGDYNSTLESVTFLAGETEKTVIVETVNDSSEEEDEIFQVEFIPENENLIDNDGELLAEARIIDNDNEEDIMLFPNPAAPSSNITLSGIPLGVYEITIFSMSGNSVVSRVVDIDSGAYEFTIPHNISGGLYMLRMQSVDNIYETKIMVR